MRSFGGGHMLLCKRAGQRAPFRRSQFFPTTWSRNTRARTQVVRLGQQVLLYTESSPPPRKYVLPFLSRHGVCVCVIP